MLANNRCIKHIKQDSLDFFLCYLQVILSGTTLDALEPTPRLARIPTISGIHLSIVCVRTLLYTGVFVTIKNYWICETDAVFQQLS